MSSYLLWDERGPFRDRLVSLVSWAPGITRIETAADVPELVARYRARQPDLVLVGTQRAVPTGIGALRRLLLLDPRAGVVVVGAGDDHETIRVAVGAGSQGYLRWEDVAGPVGTPDHQRGRAGLAVLTAAAAPVRPRSVALTDAGLPNTRGRGADEVCVGDGPMGELMGDDGRGPVVASLTERETQVLRGIARGMSNGEIGAQLDLSVDTVKTHARRLYTKLGATDRSHAVACGFRLGLLQ